MNGLLGACIMLLPLLSGGASHHNADVWAMLVVGGILMAFGMTRLLSPEDLPVLSWLNVALGACILLSPWLLRFASNETLMRADVTVGGVIMLLAAVSAKITLLTKQRPFRAGAVRQLHSQAESASGRPTKG
jgi:hypothetical protein